MKRELITKSERYSKSKTLTDRWLERKKKNKAIEDTVIFVKSKLSEGKTPKNNYFKTFFTLKHVQTCF